MSLNFIYKVFHYCPPPLCASLLRYLLPSSVMCCPPPLSFDDLSVMNVINILYSLYRGESSAAHHHRFKIKVSPIRMESIFHPPLIITTLGTTISSGKFSLVFLYQSSINYPNNKY